MKRFMVAVGFGSLLAVLASDTARAEYPVSVVNGAPTMVPTVKWHEDLQSGWREAKRRNVPMLIYITADSCVYCDAMKRDTWCNPSVLSRMANDFVAIRLNKHRNQKTLSRINVTTYPTTLIGTPNGKVIGHRLGYQPAHEVHAFFGEARLKNAKSSIATTGRKNAPIH